MTPQSTHYERARRDLQNRVASVLLLAGAVLTTLGWTGEAWGQSKLAIDTDQARRYSPTVTGWEEVT